MDRSADTQAPDFYLANFRVLANALFALCMFSSVLKIDFAGSDLSDAELGSYILTSFSALANFIVAFIFLAIYWIKFIGIQQHLARSDTRSLVLWLLYLGLLCAYPFAENLIGNYPGSPVAQASFSVIWAAIGIVGFISWWYAWHAKLVDSATDEVEVRHRLWESVPEPAAALLSIPLAFHGDWAYYGALLMVVPANVVIAKRYRNKR